MNNDDSPVNWQTAISVTAGDLGILTDLIAMFPRECEQSLQVIRQALQTGDARELTRGAHSLKSTAGFFGAAKLVACALHVEELGRESNLELARQCLTELESEAARLVDALENEHPPEHLLAGRL